MGIASRKRALRLHALREAFPDPEAQAVAAATIDDARKLHVMLHDMLDAEVKDTEKFSALLQAAYAGHGFRLTIEVIDRKDLAFNEEPTTPQLVIP